MPIEKPLYTEEPEKLPLSEVTSTLQANKDKNFVERILKPDKYKPYPIGEDNLPYTHRMATFGALDDSTPGLLVPMVVWSEEGGYHKFDNDRDAYDHAMETGEYIEFENHTEADMFQRSWKQYWAPNEE
jgi:hypothetical protein|tara:strand:+ start:587 stop:973 length:387 start_codon:yes stop_codon:yes gene_type:complete